MLRDWFQLFRAQTAPATVFSLIVPYILAGGHSWKMITFLFLVGHLLHYASFGHNSVMDYLLGFDREDPNKQHHPLPSGRIKPVRALWIINLLLATSFILLAIPAVQLKACVAMIMLAFYAIFGYAYNTGLDHLSGHSWLPISLAFAFLPLYGYYLGPYPDNIVALALWLWSFTVIFYQIAFEGNLKDLWNLSDRAPSLLRDKCQVSTGRVHCQETEFYLFARIAGYIILTLITLYLTGNIYYFAIIFILSGLAMVVSAELHYRLNNSDREHALIVMSIQEVIAFYVFLTLTVIDQPIITIILAIYGVSYFLLMNRWLWDFNAPRV